MTKAKNRRLPVGGQGQAAKSSALKRPGAEKQAPASKYRPEYAVEAEKLATIGVSQKDMAHFWGVSEDSVTRWKTRFAAFADALKKGEAKKHKALLQSMFRNAIEFRNPALQIFLAKNWLGMRDVQEQNLSTAQPIKIKIIPAATKDSGNGGDDGNDPKGPLITGSNL